MKKLIGTTLVLAAMLATGCESMKTKSSDACSHCPGVQTADADGSCSSCHGKDVAGKCTVCDAPKKM